MANHHRAIRSC